MPNVEDFDESGTVNPVDWWDGITTTACAHACHTNANITSDTYPWYKCGGLLTSYWM